ncbi:MAG: hypothetical protein H6735_13890 [Alphaproteobacteria bacterium]|nr:hypothetical protein [Alphaproteobacteria bacterium]
MSDVDPDDPRLKTRPIWGLAILVLPIIGVVFVSLAYVVMVSLGLQGRTASGAPMEIELAACDEARDVVAARLDEMGYAARLESSPGGLMARMDGPEDPEVRESLPTTLATPGLLEVRGGERVLASPEDVVDASVRLDAMMTGSTLIHLTSGAADRVRAWVRESPTGQLDFFVDGERVGGQRNDAVTAGEVEIAPPIDDDAKRLRAVAHWAIVIDHPLPCRVTVVSSRDLSP